MKLLEGQIEEPTDDELMELRGLVRDLRAELSDTKRELMQTRRESTTALAALRRQLTPLYRALQGVFGELDAAGVEETATANSETNPRTSAVWEAWKSRLGGQTAKVIGALQLHGEMNSTQLAIAIGTRRQNIPNLIFKLNQAGLINKNGGRFSLKQL